MVIHAKLAKFVCYAKLTKCCSGKTALVDFYTFHKVLLAFKLIIICILVSAWLSDT